MMLGFNAESVIYCLFSSALLTLSIIDYRTLEIPLPINIFILVTGVAATVVDYKNFLEHIIGFFAVSVFLLICLFITRGRGIGGGDIKLMAVAGLVVGYKAAIFALIVGCIVGAIIQCIIIAVTKVKDKFAFGPYLSLGLYLSLLFSDLFWDWYMNLLRVAS